MLTNFNLPILIAVVIAGIVGFIALMMNGGKIKHDNSLDDIDSDYQDRRLSGVAGTRDKFYAD